MTRACGRSRRRRRRVNQISQQQVEQQEKQQEEQQLQYEYKQQEQQGQNKSDQQSFRSLRRIDHPLLAEMRETKDTKDKCKLPSTSNCTPCSILICFAQIKVFLCFHLCPRFSCSMSPEQNFQFNLTFSWVNNFARKVGIQSHSLHDTLERSQYNFSEAEKSPPPTLPTIVGLFLPGENGEARIKHGCDVINDEIED